MTTLPAPGDSNTLYIVDLLAYVFRAYHAAKHPMSSPKGEPTHATLMTMALLNRFINDRDPMLLAVAMDSKTPSFRKSIDHNYKANRPPPPADLAAQIDRILSLIDLLGIQVWQQDGAEADDIIASAVCSATAKGLRVVIASADKDLMQLVGDRVVMWDSMRNIVYGPEEVVAKFGVRPDQMRDLLALMGDSSDNIAGIPSVGRKTAATLLAKYSSIDAIYKSIYGIKGTLQEKLATHRASLDLARKLVTLRDDLDIVIDMAALDYRQRMNLKGLGEAYAELGFSRTWKTGQSCASSDDGENIGWP